MKDYESRIANAKKIKQILKESTKGSINHFYNSQGEQIRGYHKPPIKFKENLIHPLVARYK